MNRLSLIQIIVILVVLVQISEQVVARKRTKCNLEKVQEFNDDEEEEDGRFISTTTQMLRSKGYIAKELFVRVQNNKYILNVIRATNPLINEGKSGLPDRDPILMIHGLGGNSNEFILINDRVEPRNYADLDVNSMSDDELLYEMRGDQGSYSIVFTALNFGHEVWLMQRRPTEDSRHAYVREHGLPALGSIQQDYWDFSFDEQAKYDIPELTDVILNYTKSEKVAMVGHSAGATILLMALAETPELADKVSQAIHWGIAFDFGKGLTSNILDSVGFKTNLPWWSQDLNPIAEKVLSHELEKHVAKVCDLKYFFRKQACDVVMDLLLGDGTSQCLTEHINLDDNWCHTGSMFEGSQYVQSLDKKIMHYYDYYNEEKNMAKYGQPKPPVYDLSRIKSETMSFWMGNTDLLGRISNFEMTRDRMRVKIKQVDVGDDKLLFNHIGMILHKDVAKLLVIPNMRLIWDKSGRKKPHHHQHHRRMKAKSWL